MNSSARNVEGSIQTTMGKSKSLVQIWRERDLDWTLYIATLVLSDTLLAGLAFRLSYWIRFEAGFGIFQEDAVTSIQYYFSLVLAILPLWILIYAVFGLYKRDHLLGGTEEYARVFRATTVGLLIVIIIGFLEPDLIIARGWLTLAWALTFILTAVGRFILRRIVYKFRLKGFFLKPAVLVGLNNEGRLLLEQLISWETSGLELVGLIDHRGGEHPKDISGIPVLGGMNRLNEVLHEYGVQEIIIASSALSREDLLSLFKAYGVSERVSLRMSSGLFEIITTGLHVKEMAYVPLVSVNKVRLTGADRLMKLALDYSLTLFGLLVLSPILLMIAILIKLDSRGPIIHRRRVMGLNGRQFDAFKFRTMHINGDEILAQYPGLQEELAREHKLKDDPRVTRVGTVLRRFSLDELPQLVNVLRREMSLVGPRMISPAEMANYSQWGINLLTVQPGLTGLWQVSGRSDVSYEDRVRLDMHYIRNWTIWLDLHVLLQTIPTVLKGHGAY